MHNTGPQFEDPDWSGWTIWWGVLVQVHSSLSDECLKYTKTLAPTTIGQSSYIVLSFIPVFSNNSNSSSLHQSSCPCDICLRAHQTRNTFSISDNRVNDLFDLYHFDIWGPYICSAYYFLRIVDDFFLMLFGYI